jgi:hypothetical protein
MHRRRGSHGNNRPQGNPTKLQMLVTLLAGCAAFVVLFIHYFL